MDKEFEAEVKKTKQGNLERADKREKEPDRKRSDQERPPDDAQGEDSPMKTPGGTPIIERQNG